MENSLMQPNISSDFRSHLGQAAVSAAKVRFLNLLSYLTFVLMISYLKLVCKSLYLAMNMYVYTYVCMYICMYACVLVGTGNVLGKCKD